MEGEGGRAALPTARNTEAFRKLQPTMCHLFDDDGFFVSSPCFEHCANTNSKVG
ncbi:hypothetical protein OH809_03390 [Streptomyces sp. NBC_00873]|uniref:hypothetical protein n=1 Tax=unclassified Streptomyces TaxID=2593676 RepID=UPI00386EABBF|nr:hypothetical protein OH809_03390 [Streptomyces sp. NBC_00873]WTA48079.1 hypothetical protein OH821_40405 [Streptomyces sp. NBC_00842]